MKTIRIENNFARVCPGLKIGIIGAQVTNTETDPRLWEQIDDEASPHRSRLQNRRNKQTTRYTSHTKKPIGLSVKTPTVSSFLRGPLQAHYQRSGNLSHRYVGRSHQSGLCPFGILHRGFRCRSYRRRHSRLGSRERRRNLPRYWPGRSQYRRAPGLPRR